MDDSGGDDKGEGEGKKEENGESEEVTGVGVDYSLRFR